MSVMKTTGRFSFGEDMISLKQKKVHLKVKLRTWLVICLFGISAVFSIAIFWVVQQSMEDNLLNRTKDQLNSINILKKRLVEQVLYDRQNEIANILEYQQSRQSNEADLVDAISSIPDVQMIGLRNCSGCEMGFSAQVIEDSTFYRFEYRLDTISVSVYLDYYSLSDILKERTGLGRTGESYLVAPNYKMLSESIFFPDSLPQTIICKTQGALEAISGKEGIKTYPDYRGVPIIGVYRPVSFYGLEMAILTEIDLKEAMDPIQEIRRKMMVLLVAILILSLMGSATVAEWLVRPVRRLKSRVDQLTLGALPDSDDREEFIDEFAEIINAMNKLINALKSTVAFADHIGKGQMKESYEMLSDKDELGQAIMSMRDQLVVLDQQKKELEQQSKKFLIEGQENERERIARDLHDGLGAMLTTMKLKITQKLDESSKSEFMSLLDEAIQEARNLSRNLMPSVLMDFGMYEALSQLCQTTEKNTGIAVKYISDRDTERTKLEKARQVYVYRIVQEVINNAIKHSGASEINISLTEFDDQINLYMKDNGKGFDVKTVRRSSGLGFKNIMERTELLNGKILFESGSKGTVIEIDIPIE